MQNTVTVNENGSIILDGQVLSPREAINLARDLTQATQNSIWCNQVAQPWFYDSEHILARMNSPIGRAISALNGVYRV
jgi:hypothetical protein